MQIHALLCFEVIEKIKERFLSLFSVLKYCVVELLLKFFFTWHRGLSKAVGLSKLYVCPYLDFGDVT